MKPIYHLILSLTFYLIYPVNSDAQGAYIPTLYNTSNGLAQQTINATIQDKQGYIWFATSNGFSRFDGEHFTNFHIEDDNRIGMANNLITSLREDSRRYLWLFNDNHMAFRFNPNTKEFMQLPQSFGQVNSLQILSNGDIWIHLKNNALIRAFYDEEGNLHYEKVMDVKTVNDSRELIISNDRENKIWLFMKHEVLKYETDKKKLSRHMAGNGYNFYCFRKRHNIFQVGSDNGRVYIYNKDHNSCHLLKLPTQDSIVRIKAFTDQKAIYMTANDGFFVHNLKTHKTRHYSAAQNTPYRIESNHIGDCYVDQNKNIWLTYLNSPIISCIDTAQNITTRFHLLDRHKNHINYCNKISIFEDRNKRIWFYTENKALNYYDMEHKTLLPLILPATQNMPDFTEPSNLYIDKQHNIWLGKKNKGVMKITLKSDLFKLASPQPDDLYSSANHILGLCTDRYGRLWIGARDSTIRIFEMRTRKFLGYFTEQGTITQHKTHIGQSNAIIQDHKGNMWIGTDGRGLYKATPNGKQNYTMKHFTHRPDNNTSINENHISFLLEDSSHRIWVGTASQGVNYVNERNNGNVTFYNSQNGLKNYPSQYTDVRCLCEDTSGCIWVASAQGLLRMKNNSFIFEPVPELDTDKGKFNSNAITFILKNRNKGLYFTTFGKGLWKLDKPDSSLFATCYNTEQGLPSNILYTMQEDTEGHLWIASEGGLCRFNPQNNSFQNFDNRFFPSDLTFSGNDATLTPNNHVAFATDRGLLLFLPSNVEKDIFKPNIVLTEFTANDSSICKKNKHPFSFDDKEVAKLKHTQNSFNLHFRSLDMNYPDKIQYAYKLEGFDDWHYINDNPTAVYTNIPQGKYMFRVRSTNSDGEWVNNERTLHIRILPSFWESGIGITLATFLFLTIIGIVFLILLTLYKLRQRVVMEQHLAEIKTNFFTNIVHEMRTPFTLVVSPLENVLAEKDLSPKVRRNLEIMQKNTSRSIRLINQILDFQKIESNKMHLNVSKIEIRSFLEQLLGSFAGLAESKHTKLALEMEDDRLFLWADADKMETIFFNLLSNAFKYSPQGKQITIVVENKTQSIAISVNDQGYGIPENKQAQLFNRFENFVQKQAARNIPSSGIGLSLIKELVELHHGQVKVTSRLNAGSTFTVELLKGKDHFETNTDFTVEDGEGNEPTDSTETEPEETLSTKPTILIVEDNTDLRNFLETSFATDYHPLTASNGEEGFLLAIQHSPDIIVSDIQMPIVNGMEMTKMLRNNLASSHIPVILLTSQNSLQGEIESLELGVEDYVAKPFSSKVLQARVSNILQRRQQLQQFYQSQIIPHENEESASETVTSHMLPPAEQAYIKKLTDYINAHLNAPELTVENLSIEMGTSRSVLCKKTKALIGISPIDLIRDLRFRKAAEMLSETSLTITEIAFQTGFYDSHYFSKSFKQVYGTSPSDYRKGKKKY